ncbi:hypothetical protein [Methyloglobulus sp.]|uniref:hypothetical protein n=1 Tax=Methyloglobulus sp. TaxID=2518622 RepID=UPI0039894629
MSQSVYTCIEQLDLAAQQLDRRDPSYARFALILTDNVIELIIHRICLSELSFDAMLVKIGGSRFTSKQRSYARSQYFEPKIKLCKVIGKITSNQFNVIKICHGYRNELYHAGLKYNGIIWDIALFYYDFAIDVFESAPDYWCSGIPVTPTVEKHAAKKDGRGIIHEIGMSEIANSLRQLKPSRHRALSMALSESALEQTNDAAENLEFLVNNTSADPKKRTEDEIVEELQFYDYIYSEESVKERLSKAQNLTEYRETTNLIRKSWKPKHKSNPLPKFREQAKKIAKKSEDIDGLKEFESFKNNFTYFSRVVEENAIALEQKIQQEINEYRDRYI